jgi:hypothetical protein
MAGGRDGSAQASTSRTGSGVKVGAMVGVGEMVGVGVGGTGWNGVRVGWTMKGKDLADFGGQVLRAARTVKQECQAKCQQDNGSFFQYNPREFLIPMPLAQGKMVLRKVLRSLAVIGRGRA